MLLRHLIALSALAAALLPAEAATVTVSDGWFRALPGNLPAAGYFTLKNTGTKQIALIGATTPACGMLMLHKTEQMGGMNHMSMVDRVDVPPSGTVAFAPGGYHLMCMDAGPAMKPGGSVPVTLTFDDRTTVKTSFAVKSASGK